MIATHRDPCYRWLFAQVSDGSVVSEIGSKIVPGSTAAATGSGADGHPWRSLAAAVAIAAVVYLLACWVWPWAHCGGEWLPWPRKCDGGRVYQNEHRKTWRDCRHCGGTGKRRRIGRAAWAYFIRTKRKAQK